MTPRVTAKVADAVIERDIRVAGGCVPKYLGAEGECADQFGNPVNPRNRLSLRLNHVRQFAGGARRSEVRWMNAGCWRHKRVGRRESLSG